MKTYNEVINILEESIKDHNIAKMKDAIVHCEDTIYSRVGYAGPLIYAVECNFSEGVEFLIRSFYHDAVMGPDQRDLLWRITLFKSDTVGSIVPILIEHNLLPSKHFLYGLASQVNEKKVETRNNIISSIKKEIPELEFSAYHDTDEISISKKQIQKGNIDDPGTPE
jgi:hypothetical protein